MKTQNNWQEKALQDVAFVDSGQGAPQGEKWYKGYDIFVKAGDLNNLSNGKYVGDHCKRIGKETILHYKLKKYPKNAIVFPKSGMSIKTDNIALLKYESFVVNHLAIVAPKKDDEILSKYLYYFLKQKKVSNLSLNSGYPSIRLSDINKVRIRIPQEPFLSRVVSILEAAEQLQQWRKESDELTNDYLNSVFLKMFGDPNLNEKRWSISTIGEGLKSIRYGVSSPPIFSEEGLAFIRATNIKNGKIVMKEMKYISSDEGQKIKKCELKKEEIILVRSDVNSGDCAVVSDKFVGNYAGYDLVLEINASQLNPYFLNHLLNLGTVKRKLKMISRRAGQPHLNSDQISRFKIFKPPIELQNSFAEIVGKTARIAYFQEEVECQIDDFYNRMSQKTFGENLA